MAATIGSILTVYKNTHGLCIALHVMIFFVVHVLCYVLSSNELTNDYWSMFPFSNWVKISDTLATHAKHKYHISALEAPDTFRTTIENPNCRLDVMVSKSLQDRLATNEHVLLEVVHAIIYFIKQGLPLRGHREQISYSSNPGNFLALLKQRACTDEILRKHLKQPLACNATYMSPRSQNDIVSLIVFDIIRDRIVKEVMDAKFFFCFGR